MFEFFMAVPFVHSMSFGHIISSVVRNERIIVCFTFGIEANRYMEHVRPDVLDP
jgi:hypothetical protein